MIFAGRRRYSWIGASVSGALVACAIIEAVLFGAHRHKTTKLSDIERATAQQTSRWARIQVQFTNPKP